jgi:hypothetical protein
MRKSQHSTAGMYNVDQFPQPHTSDVQQSEIHIIRQDNKNMSCVLGIVFHAADYRKVFKIVFQLRQTSEFIPGNTAFIRIMVTDHETVVTKFSVFTYIFEDGHLGIKGSFLRMAM